MLIAYSPIHNFERWQRGKPVENISYGGKSEIPEIRDSRDKKITRVTAHSRSSPSSLTDTVDDTGHMPRKSCPPLVVYLNLRPPGLSRCTVRLPILDWGRRRPTQRNHLPKKDPLQMFIQKVRKRSFELLGNPNGLAAENWPWLAPKYLLLVVSAFLQASSNAGLLLAPPLVKVGETRAAACS